jgi:uncharacterized membrane protein YdjX (TVP38/TMEM64 family)
MATRPHRKELGRRFLVPAVLVVVLVAITATTTLHGQIEAAIKWASGLISGHSVWGAVAFVVVGALSAMLAFFSSVVIIPVAVDQWGVPLTIALLWLGCTLGGCVAYAIGRFLGRRFVRYFLAPEQAQYWEEHISRRVRFPVILLFQLAVPSEIPGYVLGTVRYRFVPYLLAVSLAELPYVSGTVLLGAGFLNRDYRLMAVVGLAGLCLALWAVTSLKRAFEAT